MGLNETPKIPLRLDPNHHPLRRKESQRPLYGWYSPHEECRWAHHTVKKISSQDKKALKREMIRAEFTIHQLAISIVRKVEEDNEGAFFMSAVYALTIEPPTSTSRVCQVLLKSSNEHKNSGFSFTLGLQGLSQEVEQKTILNHLVSICLKIWLKEKESRIKQKATTNLKLTAERDSCRRRVPVLPPTKQEIGESIKGFKKNIP